MFQCVVITAEQRLDAILFGAQPDAFGAGQAGSEVGQTGVTAPGFSLIGLRLAFALAAEWRAEFLLKSVDGADLGAQQFGHRFRGFGVARVGEILEQRGHSVLGLPLA